MRKSPMCALFSSDSTRNALYWWFIYSSNLCINFTILSRVGGVTLLAWNLKGPKIEFIFLRDSILFEYQIWIINDIRNKGSSLPLVIDHNPGYKS